MAGHYRNPSYRQYLSQELLDELREVSRATRRPMQQIVRVAVRRFLIELRTPTVTGEETLIGIDTSGLHPGAVIGQPQAARSS